MNESLVMVRLITVIEEKRGWGWEVGEWVGKLKKTNFIHYLNSLF